jgi:hypothetical protein
MQTVCEYWDYDFNTGDWWEILVEDYSFGVYDLDVCGP